MAKTVTQMDDNGRIVTHKETRSQRKSEARAIPWTPGPQTWWERRKRDWVG